MRPPSPTLVVDANILIAGAVGRRSGVLSEVGRVAALITTDRAVAEARRRIEFGMHRPELLELLDDLIEEMEVVAVGDLLPFLPACAVSLRDAPPSRNGSTDDAHLLALAWNADADIWSFDRDFAGTGVATWSTVNLLRALVDARPAA